MNLDITYLIACFFICGIITIIVYEKLCVKYITTNKYWHDPNTQFDAKLGWSPIPKRGFKHHKWGKITTNSLGFRSEELDQNKKQIIVLGDSVAWGYGVSDEETMPYLLEQKLQSLDYQVSNLAVSGYGINDIASGFSTYTIGDN